MKFVVKLNKKERIDWLYKFDHDIVKEENIGLCIACRSIMLINKAHNFRALFLPLSSGAAPLAN